MGMNRLSFLPDWLKAGVMGGVFTFITGVAATLVGWINDVANWATAGGKVPFPDPSLLRGALASAGVAAGVFVVNAAIRGIQERLGLGLTPDYTPADGDLGPPTTTERTVIRS